MMAEVSRIVLRHGGERIEVHGGWLSFRPVVDPTVGAYVLVETANDSPTGVRLHIHERQDYGWLILEGEYVFQVCRQTISAHAGDFVFAPRNVPHSYAHRSAAVARALIMATPAGFEGIWRESARLGPDMAAHVDLT